MSITDEQLTFICRNIRKIENEYLPAESHPDRIWGVLVRLWQLPEMERQLMILYTEIGSYRKLGEVLGISRQTVWNRLQQIRKKLR